MLFTDIVGHSQPKKLLMNALIEGRVAHAYLFHGAAGVGKKSLARALAANLLCSNRDNDACGSCLSCRKVAENIHPDFFIIEPSGNNIKIDQVRELQKKAQYKPYEGTKKIFLIDSAERMTRDAANCLLKVLEEPPRDTVFVLTTNNLYSLMSTIVSRCQVIPIGKVSIGEIELLLSRNEVDLARAKLFAALSDGIPKAALELAYAEPGQELRGLVFEIEENLKKSDINQIFKIAEDLEKNKKLPEIIDHLMMWYRDCLIWAQTKNEALIVNLDRLDILKNRQEDKDKLLRNIEFTLEAKRSIKQNVNTRLAVEVLLMRLADLTC